MERAATPCAMLLFHMGWEGTHWRSLVAVPYVPARMELGDRGMCLRPTTTPARANAPGFVAVSLPRCVRSRSGTRTHSQGLISRKLVCTEHNAHTGYGAQGMYASMWLTEAPGARRTRGLHPYVAVTIEEES